MRVREFKITNSNNLESVIVEMLVPLQTKHFVEQNGGTNLYIPGNEKSRSISCCAGTAS